MKRIALVSIAFLYSCFAVAQHTIPLRNLWAEPHVHVLFNGYTVSFTIKDINRALQILNEAGDSSYGVTSGLDTGRQYNVELYAGYNIEYRKPLQQLIQRAVGAYLLSIGHAEIENPRHKKLKDVVVDAQSFEGDDTVYDVKFYDTKTGKLLFNAMLPIELYNKDIGIDY